MVLSNVQMRRSKNCNKAEASTLISRPINSCIFYPNLRRVHGTFQQSRSVVSASLVTTLNGPLSSAAQGRAPCIRSLQHGNGLVDTPSLVQNRPHGRSIQRSPALPPSTTAVADADGDTTPVHPRAMRGLYLMYLCACLTERTWRFALPLVLAYVKGGYQAIAVLGFVSPLACSLFGPALGRMMDKLYRPYGLGITTVLQGISIITSGLVLLKAASSPGAAIAEGPLFVALLLLSMVERLTAIASELAIERDWVTQLSGKDNALALAKSNAMLRRTDLSCELIGSLMFGWLYTTAGLAASVAAATLLAATLLPMQLYCIVWIARLAPEAMIHGRDEASVAMFNKPWKQLLTRKGRRSIPPRPRLSLGQKVQDQLVHALDGWKAYFRQPILPSSLTFVLLFFNVALSPGGLITAFLTAKGLDGTGMAFFRGGCAAMGFAGTWVGRRLIRNYGLLQAGSKALAIQATCLTVATLVYAIFLSGPLSLVVAGSEGPSVGGISAALVAFSLAVVVSRIGMWSYDMVNAQLFQQAVSQREVASASSAEMALCSFSELVMLGLAAYVITPESYSTLIYGSFCAVMAANALFRWWARRVAAESSSEEEEEDGPSVLAAAAAA